MIYDYHVFSPEIYVLRYHAPGEPKLSALNQSIAINGRGEDATSRDRVKLAVHREALRYQCQPIHEPPTKTTGIPVVCGPCSASAGNA